MDIRIQPSRAVGSVTAPPSKSMAHRLLIVAGLSNGCSVIEGVEFSQDIYATVDCLRALGVRIEVDEQQGRVAVFGRFPFFLDGEAVLPCRESGSTMRFFIPLALLLDKHIAFTGAERLLERPMTIYEDICSRQGLQYSRGNSGIEVCGPLRPGLFTMPGDVSSQFLTGLLLALPLLPGDSDIVLTTSLESRPYVDLTLAALKNGGIAVEEVSPIHFRVPGNQSYTAVNGRVEGDYSNAAFLEALNMLGGDVTVDGLRENSLQGDRIYRTYFRRLANGSPTLDIHDCPDLAPILMTLAAELHGCTLQGTRRLRIKESDRGTVMERELRKFGADITVNDDTIVIRKSMLHKPKVQLSGHNDHRIVMSLAVLATKYGGEIVGAHAVTKSYPSFWEIMQQLGIQIELL